MEDLLELIRSLDRCPHGWHAGEECVGWVGPSIFDGGCLGGRSLGNPYLHAEPPGRIGTDRHGFPITINDVSIIGGVLHWTQYVVKMGNGILRSKSDSSVEKPGETATLEEAQEFAASCGDPLARVMVQRVCSWTASEYTLPLPASPEPWEQSKEHTDQHG